MNKIKLITDSCCSLSADTLKALDIDFIAMDITVNHNTQNSFEIDTKNPKAFYEHLEKAEQCATSCINTFSFTEMFEKYVKQNMDVIYMGLSSGLSCTYQNALKAAEELNATYGKHVWVADSLTGSFGIALMLETAKNMIDKGSSAEAVFEAIDKNHLRVFSIFAPGDLKFLKRSGRISKFVASIGSILKIVPVIQADGKGELKLFSKSIGRKKALHVIQNYVAEMIDKNTADKVYIGHTGQQEEAEQLAAFVKSIAPNKEIIVDFIDYTMGCNCGPKTVAIFGFIKS